MFGNQLIKASNISRAQLNGQAGASRSKLLKKEKKMIVGQFYLDFMIRFYIK